MDYEEDGLPCGGFEGQDQKIQQNLEALSLETQKKEDKKGEEKGKKEQCCGKNNCCQKQVCGSKNVKNEVKREEKIKKGAPCKKCKQNNSVLMHKNEPMCKECLLKNIPYKARLALQSSIKVKPKSKILLCFSGGLNSICLVEIMSQIKKKYQKHHLFGDVQCIHIQQQDNLPQNYQQIFEEKTQFKLNIISVSEILEEKSMQNMRKLFSLFPKNSNNIDLLQMFRNRLIIKFAAQNKFDFIFKGLNGETIATQIFKYFTKGIGGNITNLCHSQDTFFQYPLKQHLQKELQYYFYAQRLSILSLKSETDDLSQQASKQINTHLESFISILQNRYSHTAPAIVRTGEKVESNLEKQNVCSWCFIKYRQKTDDEICRKCQRLKESLKGKGSQLFPKWMKV